MGSSLTTRLSITWILREFCKVAINTFHHCRSYDGVDAIQGVSNTPEILAGLWYSGDGHLSGTLESAECVDPRGDFKLRSSEVQSSDGQEFLVGDKTCKMTSPNAGEYLKKRLSSVLLPASVSCVGEIESQLHLAVPSTQL